MSQLYRAFAPVAFFAAAMSPAGRSAVRPADPLRFFAGITESVGTTKVLMHRPLRTQSIGRGEIKRDGSLSLVQQVKDEGRPPYLRRWEIRQIGPGRFAGTMSEAEGPVLIEQVGNRYRFTFKMKGGMSVEQWLTPLAGGLSASSDTTVRKFGLAVASSTAVVRKLS